MSMSLACAASVTSSGSRGKSMSRPRTPLPKLNRELVFMIALLGNLGALYDWWSNIRLQNDQCL